MPTVKVSDINMYYETYGAGEPLLLITGLSADLTGWILQTVEFSRTYHVIALDNRGSGRTDAPDIPYSIEMMADDTAGLLDALNIDQVHILGLSMGGCIAQEFALKYPQRAKSLILAATLGRPHPRCFHVLRTLSMMAREGISRENQIRMQLFWLFTDRFFEVPENIQLVFEGMMANPYSEPLYAYDRKLAALSGFDARHRISQIKAPTLVLVGREDILTPVQLSEELAAGIGGAELVILEGGGHAFSGEISEKFNQAVLEFLAKQK